MAEQRDPQLVRQHRQELVLGAIGGFGSRARLVLQLDQPRTLGGEHRAIVRLHSRAGPASGVAFR